jgi:hypothetical protein
MELVSLIIFTALILSWLVLPSTTNVDKVAQPASWTTPDTSPVVGADA